MSAGSVAGHDRRAAAKKVPCRAVATQTVSAVKVCFFLFFWYLHIELIIYANCTVLSFVLFSCQFLEK